MGAGSSSALVVTPSYHRVASPMDSGSEVTDEVGDTAGIEESDIVVEEVGDAPGAKGDKNVAPEQKDKEMLIEEAPIEVTVDKGEKSKATSQSPVVDEDQMVIAELMTQSKEKEVIEAHEDLSVSLLLSAASSQISCLILTKQLFWL